MKCVKKEERIYVGEYTTAKYPRVRIEREAYEKLCFIANETDRTLNDIVTTCIDFAISQMSCEVEEIKVERRVFRLAGEEV
ncbi:hypothetical protein [Abiotrophia defectiva]|jgi:hypothetical protein|uniref:hypothetical protein n=1 Tax=Abiotrophia defectiva TaxID=46125 RepID=UPI002054C515|nr:hypothetical protein [Abiotrophia defectiva]DAR81289.1 MAG TPA: Transcriptional repressor arc(10) helix, beta-ribbon, beta-sheet, structural [Caudoviricetes sp.]